MGVILDLKKFISESLYQIVGGINAAQERIAEYNAEVESKLSTDCRDVFFDVALTVVGEEEPELLVMGLSHFGSASFEQMLSLVSRVRFAVPLIYSSSKNVSPPYLHFNTH